MDAQLKPLFRRLHADDKSALAEIVDLTSPHIFGIICQRVPDRTKAEIILRQFYGDLWHKRKNKLLISDDILNTLRAFAHHCCIKAVMADEANSLNFFAKNERFNASKYKELGTALNINKDDLKDAYLQPQFKRGGKN